MDKREVFFFSEGSITVFLTCVFLLFYSLIGVAWEHARVFSAGGYMQVAARQAAMTLFGDFNKELYEEYGLFAYGGYDGIGVPECSENLRGLLEDNLAAAPEHTYRPYVDFYRFRNVEVSVEKAVLLSDSEEFCRQVEAFLKADAAEKITDSVFEKLSGRGDSVAEERLRMAEEYEEGKYDPETEEDGGQSSDADAGGALSEEDQTDDAGGNPLEFFREMMRDGILNLVCDAELLEDGTIESSEEMEGESDSGSGQDREESASKILQNLLEDGGQGIETGAIHTGAQKLETIAYADRQFSNYTKDRGRTTKYGLEYLAAGKGQEKDNLAYVVNRILVTRLLLNFSCIAADSGMQKKSLATATAIAGFTGLQPVVTAVQYIILLILAFQEACVDMMALLDGREVPVFKTAENLKMKYEEICKGSRQLFKEKASGYPKAENASAQGVSYTQYLWLLLALQPKDTIVARSYDLIQYDLRERYNQSFCISSAVCRAKWEINWEIPFLFSNLPLQNEGIREKTESLEVEYGYKNG